MSWKVSEQEGVSCCRSRLAMRSGSSEQRTMSYPLMDALYSAFFRMTLDEVAWLEVKRHGYTLDMLTRAQILSIIYCNHAGRKSFDSGLGFSLGTLPVFSLRSKRGSGGFDDLVLDGDDITLLSHSIGQLSDNELSIILEMMPEDEPRPGPKMSSLMTKGNSGGSRVKFSTSESDLVDLLSKERGPFDLEAGLLGGLSKGKSTSSSSARKTGTTTTKKKNRESTEADTIALHKHIVNKDRSAMTNLIKSTNFDLDMCLPVKGVTALSLSIYLQSPEMTKEVLNFLSAMGQIRRAINMTSTDNAGRRETPIITAARTGQVSVIELLLEHSTFLDLETRDNEGKTALWHAVREEMVGAVEALIKGGAKVYYQNEDLSCPLQLAMKTMLLKRQGKRMAKMLVSHGASLEYVDHALRNALYWSVYNSCGDLTHFLLQAGARIKAWSWFQDDALPNSFLESPALMGSIRASRSEPSSLKILSRRVCRRCLMARTGGRSIHPLIDALHVSNDLKKLLKLENGAKKSTTSL